MKFLKYFVLVSVVVGIIFMIGKVMNVWDNTSSIQRQSISHYGDAMQMTDNRTKLHDFIVNKLGSEHGIYTNLLDTNQQGVVATGHEVLSESAGLLMRYYTLTGQQDKFDQQWQLAKRTFDTPSGFSYRYSPKLNKRHPMNATVDDLRIIRALNEASLAFDSNSYQQESETYGKRFYQYNVMNGQLRDFYDPTYKMTNSFVTLCYIDVASLELAQVSNKKKAALEANMIQIAQNGYLSDTFPLYQTRYDFNKNDYESETINTVESLLTILNLAEVNQAQPTSIQYIKEHVKTGTLFGQYDRTGKPLNDVRSTAIYAISAMIGSVMKDQELYADSILKMNEFQIHDPQSPIYGGFGDTVTGQAYSFDNLMALLAYMY